MTNHTSYDLKCLSLCHADIFPASLTLRCCSYFSLNMWVLLEKKTQPEGDETRLRPSSRSVRCSSTMSFNFFFCVHTEMLMLQVSSNIYHFSLAC